MSKQFSMIAVIFFGSWVGLEVYVAAFKLVGLLGGNNF